MKNIKKYGILLMLFILPILVCACSFNDDSNCKINEKIKLQSVVLNEVEFKNGENVSLNQSCDEIEIGGVIDAMTEAEKSVFGVNDVSHVVSINLMFDKERTLSYFEIKGNQTKVYSTNSEDDNFVGNITDILDNEPGEDAYCGLILSANTKNYKLTIRYTDGTESIIDIIIKATLADALTE